MKIADFFVSLIFECDKFSYFCFLNFLTNEKIKLSPIFNSNVVFGSL